MIMFDLYAEIFVITLTTYVKPILRADGGVSTVCSNTELHVHLSIKVKNSTRCPVHMCDHV